jgi:hypothetical protein
LRVEESSSYPFHPAFNEKFKNHCAPVSFLELEVRGRREIL